MISIERGCQLVPWQKQRKAKTGNRVNKERKEENKCDAYVCVCMFEPFKTAKNKTGNRIDYKHKTKKNTKT